MSKSEFFNRLSTAFSDRSIAVQDVRSVMRDINRMGDLPGRSLEYENLDGAGLFSAEPTDAEPVRRVTVHISGGVAQDVEVPPGVEVAVVDYDNDPDGDECVYTHTTEVPE